MLYLWAWKLCEGVRLVQDDPRGLESHDAVCWACRVGCVRATASSTPAQSCFFSLRLTDADPTSVCIPRLAWRLLSRSPINNFCWCMSVSVCVHTCKRVLPRPLGHNQRGEGGHGRPWSLGLVVRMPALSSCSRACRAVCHLTRAILAAALGAVLDLLHFQGGSRGQEGALLEPGP